MKIQARQETPLDLLPLKRRTYKSKKPRSLFWKIRSDIPKPLFYPMVGLSIFIPICAWSVLTYGGFVKPLFLPTPTAVIQRFWNSLQSGEIVNDALTSISRVGWVF
jgi:NitT/TauT family transport system permease protein